ncbi:glycerophosphodiester phosphodiesterase [Schaalia suimastitidis]|uniref:glycerophosphodiester phosphodiesterase n=1 Tax=Schaalia suimastitidis TaxID=121163 RepID=UPI000409DC16|nr:glycerophosphodiester phosphodiesterase [Schaalia suimastitidis]
MYPVTGARGPLVIAHRGGGAEAPENSEEAFEALRRLGVRHIETDAHLSADGVVVVNHDETVDRTFNGSGRIAEMTWDELSALEGKDGQKMRTLEEMLDAFPDMYFNIDAKSAAVAVPLVELLYRKGALDRCLVASFSQRRLDQLRQLYGPRLTTSLGTVGVIKLVVAAQTASDAAAWGVPGPKQGVRAVQVPVTHGPLRVVDRRFVAAAHRNGLAVHVWTINEAAQMHRLLDLGVDGIVTDYPSIARAVMLERGVWQDVPPPVEGGTGAPRD